MHKTPHKPLRVLHIDSDPAFAQEVLLSLLDHPTPPNAMVHVTSLRDAIAALDQEKFDVVLSDLNVEDSHGLDTCCTLRTAAPRLPLVILTTKDDVELALAAVRAGAQDYVLKDELDSRQLMRTLLFAMTWQRRQLSRQRVSAARRDKTPVDTGVDADEDGDKLGSVERPIRVLQIDEDQPYARLLRTVLMRQADVQFDIEHAVSFSIGSQRLGEQAFDAVLLALSPEAEGGFEMISRIHASAPHTPVLVLVTEANDMTALAAIRAGAHDYLEKAQLDHLVLMRSVRLAIARSGRVLVDSTSPDAAPAAADAFGYSTFAEPSPPTHPGAPVSAPNTSPAESLPDRRKRRRDQGSDRRRHSRYHVTKPVLAIPILPDNDPDWQNRVEGYSLDLSAGGISFEFPNLHQALSRTLLVGMANDSGEMYYSSVRVKRVSETASGVRVRAEFCRPDRELFRDENTLPHLDPETHQLTTGLDEETLNHWADLGVVHPQLMDRVLLCPECGGLPTFRNGCPACGSARVNSPKMIHHFACAHIGHAEDFELDGELVCPKCRTRKLVMGTDFEYLQGPYVCHDCNRSDVELQSVGHCLGCGLRFPSHQAAERELIAYHVNRLVPLDFIGAH